MSSNNNKPHEYLADAIPIETSEDLVQIFINKQIELWGFESVQRMFDDKFEPRVIHGKVLWVK